VSEIRIEFYGFQGRQVKESPWLRPTEPLRNSKSYWYSLNPDVFGKSISPQGKNYTALCPQAAREINEVWQAANKLPTSLASLISDVH